MSGAADLQQIVTGLTRMARTRPDMALRQARSLLRPGGVFSLWSDDPPDDDDGGCGCAASGPATGLWLLPLLLWLWIRRR